jgi:hypothetical protein
MERRGRGQAQLVGDVVAALAVVLILGVWIVIMSVMVRAARAQRTRVRRTDFGARYSDFGFLLGVLTGNRRRKARKMTPHASDAEDS